MSILISLVIAYLLGSLSGAMLIAKVFDLPDPRTQGSGNAGATNMLRHAGKKAAIWVLLIDLFKGLLAVWLGRIFGCSDLALGFVALAAVAGHVYPLFFKFKGGKGVATALGVLFGLSFWVGLLVLITWLIVALLTRYSSLASIVATIAAPVYVLIATANSFLPGVLLIMGLILVKHWGNMQRLRDGSESKIHFSTK